MIKVISILLLFLANFSMHSQEEKKIGLLIESQIMNVHSSLNPNRLGLSVSLAADYRLKNKLYAGAYFMGMKDVSGKRNSNYLINGKTIDITTSSFSSIGIYTGYEVYKIARLTIIPEIRLGYGSFEAKSTIPNANTSEHLSVRMITCTPRALASYKISNGFSTGISVGYMFMSYVGDTKLPEYNLQNLGLGAFLKINMNRCR